MFGATYLPPSSEWVRRDEFVGTAVSMTYEVSKPAGSTMLFLFGIGAGGAGGAGFVGAASAAGGGAGGGSGAIGLTIVSAQLLPQYLYVRMGRYGSGANTAEASGVATQWLNNSVVDISWLLGLSAPGNGAAGAASGSAAGGTAAAVISPAAPTVGFGRSVSIAGQVGAAGGAATTAGAGLAITFPTTGLCVSGGGGGGAIGTTGTGGAGGSVSAPIGNPVIWPPFPTGGAGGTAGNSGSAGKDGAVMRLANTILGIPMLFSGGSGGGGASSTGLNGAAGGKGGYGCGGGGGGAALTGNTAGTGGDGGPSYICLIWV